MITWIILRYAMYSKESSFNGKRIGYTEWWKLRTFGVKKENRPALIQKIAKDNIPVKKSKLSPVLLLSSRFKRFLIKPKRLQRNIMICVRSRKTTLTIAASGTMVTGGRLPDLHPELKKG
jgi:hypothetical protein